MSKRLTTDRSDEVDALHRAIEVKGIRIAIFMLGYWGAHFCSGRTRLPNSGLNTLQRHRFGQQSLLSWVSLGTPTET